MCALYIRLAYVLSSILACMCVCVRVFVDRIRQSLNRWHAGDLFNIRTNRKKPLDQLEYDAPSLPASPLSLDGYMPAYTSPPAHSKL